MRISWIHWELFQPLTQSVYTQIWDQSTHQDVLIHSLIPNKSSGWEEWKKTCRNGEQEGEDDDNNDDDDDDDGDDDNKEEEEEEEEKELEKRNE